MFKITNDIINSAIENANIVLKNAYKNYVEPDIENVCVTKAKSYWMNIGKNRSYKKGWGIHISNQFEKIPDEKAAQLRFETSMIHELIHTIPGCLHHGRNFKNIGRLVNKMYSKSNPAEPKCLEDYGVQVQEQSPKYKITCQNCGKDYLYMRKPKYDISHYYCTVCNKDSLKIIKI